MQLEKPASVGSYEFHQPNAFAPIDPALGRLPALSPTAQPVQIPVCVGLAERAGGSAAAVRFTGEIPKRGLTT
jgi:hypothetical protein